MEQERETVTFLFSDIEGSTRLVQELGERWPATLERHRELIRAAVSASGGEELGTEGDSFFVAFASASRAIAAVVAAQRALAAEQWPDGFPPRVRMGLHTGEADRSGGSYTGIDVHRAARIMAAGHGGQVLLSAATQTLVGASLDPGLTLRDLGMHRLKDLPAPERIYQLVIDGLPSDFSALRSEGATPNNLPVQLTSFLGRAGEIAEVSALLDAHRLLTLTGPGGAGKTRLALQVAARAMDRFPDGVYFVPLSPLNEVELVAPTIAHALGLADHGGRLPEERILEYIADKRVLFVLDNFEQLIPASLLVNQLLTRAPKLTALVTSRETLHLYGEQEYAVPPLGLPPVDPAGRANADTAALAGYEAVALFVERAAAAEPGFALNDENAAAVAALCVRLDGLPLAIELAAARVRILSPAAILRRLGDQLDLLSGGGADRPARQQTLRGAIAWSYDLLDDRDRTLLAALSVFVGGATLDAIEEVCAPIVPGDVLDGLSSLVDKSLLSRRTEDDEPRFALLHTIREFAVERARELGIFQSARRRHAEAYARLAAEARAVIMGSDKRRWLDRLELEHDNLRAALVCATEAGEARLALDLAADLWRFWQMRGYLVEGLERLRQALALPADPSAADARLRAVEAAGGVAYWQGDLATSEAYYAEALAGHRASGDEQHIADALYNLSFVYAIPTSSGGMADPERAAELVAEALAIYRRVGDKGGVARSLWSLSNASWISGDVERGAGYADEALHTFRELDDKFMVGWSLYTLGVMRIQNGEIERGGPPLREALTIFSEAEDISGYVLVLDGLAAEAFHRGDLERSARLAGAVSTLQASSGTGLTPANRELIGFSHEPLRADLSLADAWAEGERMTPSEAVAYALQPPAAPSAQPGAARSRRGKTTSA